ncbi:Neogenin [Actinoplanes sp. SE50]|uniref:Neogenin n=1 Tax=unclassified Actinoplanes TaxID=2626549 RepID=UPI00023EBBD8|nr:MULTISPECIES: Neogenin [unclassified Actinoplanes]AEV85693.1 Neogenin [Actinoplanes sp. SE50/110]ATO84086.1 Neogenin [Actinoplanes sp. SE50]SLM01496.1 Neogenin [Actinoplanes sp. SE50/110]
MDRRRLLGAVGVLTTMATSLVATPAAALSALAAPKNLTVARAADDVHQIKVGWIPVTGADHYAIDILAGDVETVLDLPATATGYTIDAPNPCTAYKVRIGAVDAAGTVANTGFWSLRALTPSAVMGMAPTRIDEGTTAVATWREPAWTGYTPLTGYHSVFTRLSDGAVLADQTSTGLSFTYPGIDPSRAYTLAVTTVNQYGACVTAKSLLDRFRPADPTDLVVKRLAEAPGTVSVSWTPPANGPAPTFYQVGYGIDKVTKTLKLDTSVTATTLALATDKAWIVEVKAYNDNGGSSAVSGSVPVFEASGSPPATDATWPSTSTVVDNGPDRTPPSITATLSQKPVNGWFRTPVTIQFTCADDSGTVAVCPAPILANTDGLARRFAGTAKDAAGNTTTTTLTLKVDQKAPSITATVLGTKNAAGWYTTAPTIHYTCADETSTIASCPADTVVSAGKADQKISGIASDKAGNTATATVVLSVDPTTPKITASVTGDVSPAGWYTTAPTVHFSCSDGTSGVVACPADVSVSADGAGQKVSGTVTDRAGNTAATSVTVNVDQAAPGVTTTVSGATANAGGWYRTAPTVHFTCTDETSGVATCPADSTAAADGAGQVLAGTATDRAGNTGSGSVIVNVDGTAPTISAAVLGATANAGGWYHDAPTVHFTCTDTGSGVASCPADIPVGTDGAGQVVTGTALDAAGNTAATSVTVNVDRTAPAITATVLGATANAGGWYHDAPTIHYTCTDTGSGIASCPADTPLTEDGTARTLTGTATDLAGNSATVTTTVSLDRVAPSIGTTISGGTANTNGWYNTAPTITFTCADDRSGVAACGTGTTVGTDGAGQKVTGTVTDRAGNTASTGTTVNLDRVAPQITATVTGSANRAGWYTAAPTVKFTCTDDRSGVVTCPADQVVTDGAAQKIAGTVADRAGNTASTGTTLNVDRQAPVVTIAGATNGAVYGPDAAPVVTCVTADAVSGVAGKATLSDYESYGKHTVICSGAVDKAGNAAPAVQLTYSVKPTIEWLIALTHKDLPRASAVTLKQLDADLMGHRWTAYTARVTALSLGAKPELTVADATTLVYWAVMLPLYY